MRGDQAITRSSWSAVEITAAGRSLDKILESFGDVRDEQDLTSDEALIFLAVGRLGLTPSTMGVAVHPVTCLNVSELLKIPTETVRRKAGRLVERGFFVRTTRGLLVKRVDEWRRLAEKFV